MQVEFHALAEARLLEIWSYTEEHLGDAQADRYIRGLIDAADQLSDPVYAGRPVNDPDNFPGSILFAISITLFSSANCQKTELG